ncbi:MAG: NAD(P)H-hydrate dehydratase [Planctomycetes bacterium]|nr:NAD(P)H-hydrate dehydratase [Planctomycetota bacterium]
MVLRPADRRLPPRPRAGHKGTFGTVLVVAGSHGMLGAAVLAATAALRGGAGLVQVCVPRALQPFAAVAQPCATTIARTPPALRAAVAAAQAIVVGPGLGATAATRALVRAVLRTSRAPVVLDADALNVLAPLRRPLVAAAPVVLTPHPGEAARLLATTSAAVQADRRATLQALVARSGAVVVLKGEGTLVGAAASWYRNRTGNPGLATGGSGDVLAGLLGALLAQGLPPFRAACLAVFAHGKAADRLRRRTGEAGLIASDLPLAIAEVLR